MMPKSLLLHEAIKRTAFAIFFIIAIYASILFTPPIVGTLRNSHLLTAITAFSVALLIGLGFYFSIRYTGFSVRNCIVLAIFFTLYLLIIASYRLSLETMHFIEYGILSLLVYHALRSFMKSFWKYPLTLLIVAIVGWGDEFIQFFTPERDYDPKDMALNVFSSILILTLISILEKLKGHKND